MKNKILIVLLISIAFTNCSKDDVVDDNSLPENRYQIISLTSDIPMDLNLNGTPTTDFLIELENYFKEFKNEDFRIRNNIQFNINLLELNMPSAFVFPEFNLNNVIYLTRSSTYGYVYNKQLNEIRHTNQETDSIMLSYGGALIEKVELLENKNLKVKMKHKFYFHPTGWQDVSLVGVYQIK